MKKRTALLTILLIPLFVVADNWDTLVPQGIPVSYIDINPSCYHYISDNTFYVNNQNVDSIAFNLLITDTEAVTYDNSMFITVGNGSYSDALYKYKSIDGELSRIEFFWRPQFIDEYNDTYYLGTQGALYQSSDGLDWSIHTDFDDNELVINYYQLNEKQMMLVRKTSTNHETKDYIYHSEDNGATWQADTLNGIIVDNDFNRWSGNLALILADNNDETAIYKSSDNGHTVSHVKSLPNLNLIEILSGGYGLAQSRDTSQAYGVSMYVTEFDKQVFLNDNLPTRNILFLESFPMDCFNLIIGTDVGAFYICGNFTNIIERSDADQISVNPNPTSGEINIQTSTSITQPVTILISNIDGKTVYKTTKNNIQKSTPIKLDINHLPHGCYIISLYTAHKWIGKQKIIKNR